MILLHRTKVGLLHRLIHPDGQVASTELVQDSESSVLDAAVAAVFRKAICRRSRRARPRSRLMSW